MKDCLKGSDWGQRPEHQGQQEDAETTSLPPWLGRALDGGFRASVTSRAMGENKKSNDLRKARLSCFFFSLYGGREVTKIGYPCPRISTFREWHTTDKAGLPTCSMRIPRLWSVGCTFWEVPAAPKSDIQGQDVACHKSSQPGLTLMCRA